MQNLPRDQSFKPISLQARLVIGQDPSVLFAPTSRLIYSTQSMMPGDGEPVERFLEPAPRRADLRILTGAVVPGSTVSFEITLPEDAPLAAELSRRKIAISVDRVAGDAGYELVLVSDDLLQPQKNIGQEKVVIRRELSIGADRLVLSVPMRFPHSTTKGLIIDLTVDAKGADAPAIASMQKEIDASSLAATERRKQTSESTAQAAITAALNVIDSGQAQRGTLAYIADETGARLTSAVIMAADDRALALIVAEVKSRLPASTSHDRETVSWMLDRATLKAISSIKPEDAPTSLPPIIGALSAFAGDAGRELDVLQSLAAQSAGSDDLYARITAEQYIALEDNSPSVRVRAWDWLSAHATPPTGYDPLGPARLRRAALEKFSEAATQPASHAVSK